MTVTSNEYMLQGGGFCPTCKSKEIILMEPLHISGYEAYLHEDPMYMCLECNTTWIETREITGYTDLKEGKK